MVFIISTSQLHSHLLTFFAFSLPSYSPFFNFGRCLFGHIKSHVRWDGPKNNRTILGHINYDAQAIVVDVAQGWTKEVTQNFARASHEEQLGENYTWS